LDLSLTDALLPRWCAAISEGHGDNDVAAAITQAVAAHPSHGKSLTSTAT
jgi:hypothetical protein